jgi:hypothetical protein
LSQLQVTNDIFDVSVNYFINQHSRAMQQRDYPLAADSMWHCIALALKMKTGRNTQVHADFAIMANDLLTAGVITQNGYDGYWCAHK